MKRSSIYLITFCLFSVLFYSCGGSSTENTYDDSEESSSEETVSDEALENPQEAMQQAMKEIEKAVEESGVGKVEPVNFRTLKELLPSSIAGIERTNASGEKSGAMGIKLSKAEGTYRQDDKRVEVTITDMGSMSAGGMMGGMFAAGWLMAEIDRESDKEYERTTTIDGHKAYEKYNSERNKGELSVMVEGRFLVQIEGNNVSIDDLKDALDEIDLDELESMKDEGVEK